MNLRNLWDPNTKSNIHVIRVPEEKGRAEKVLEEIIAKNCPNLAKDTNLKLKS